MNKTTDVLERALYKKAQVDKRLIGAGIAGLVGGAAGAFGLPDLIYKKPTKGSRVGLGISTGALSALAALAAMRSDQKDPNALQTTSDLIHNIPTILDRKTIPELKQMSGLTRFVRGYGGGIWNPFRNLWSALPERLGFSGTKSKRDKDLEEKGELPKSQIPSAFATTAKSLNPLIAGLGGWWHNVRMNNRFQQREAAKQLVTLYGGMEQGLKDALRNSSQGANLQALAKKLAPSSGGWWADIKKGLGSSWDTLKAQVGIKGKSINPNKDTSSLIDRILNLRLTGPAGSPVPNLDVVPGGGSGPSYRTILSKMKDGGYKRPVWGVHGKVWTGARTLGRSLAIMMVLGFLDQRAGLSNNNYYDLGRNLNIK